MASVAIGQVTYFTNIEQEMYSDTAYSHHAIPADAHHPQNIVDHICQTVFDSIVQQRLVPGTKLPESALCKLFNVGRTTVQKALQKLAHDHIVELRANRGAIVAMPDKAQTGEIFAARRALESGIMALAIRQASKADLQRLKKQLQQEHTAMHSHSQREWAMLASSFHMQIAEISGNAILQRYLAELISRTSLIVAAYEPGGHAPCEHDEHTHIVNLMENGDVAGAIAAMDAHLVSLEKHLFLDHSASENTLAHMLGMS